VFNTESHNDLEQIDSVYADSCHPPKALGKNRGSYFSGENESLEIHNFELAARHSVDTWVKLEKGGGTLSLFETKFFAGWSRYSPPCNCTDSEYTDEFRHGGNGHNIFDGFLELWVTDCYTPVVEFRERHNMFNVD
jgi:hypothetical protein